MELKELIKHISMTENIITSGIEIKNIHIHSKLIEKGSIFFAISGYNNDGHEYIQEAVGKGAVAVVGEKEILTLSVPYIRVPDVREALGKVASDFYGHPSKMHKMIGVTGTNGKTTTSHMISKILQGAGHTCSLIGTLGMKINKNNYESKSTTPDTITLQRMLCESKDECVVMEVSSHGIHQKRIEGTTYDFVIFTNLSHEHLDYHASMEEYFNVKSSLFEKLKPGGEAIVNSSCPWGKKLIERLREKGIPTLTFGKENTDNLQLLSVIGKEQQEIIMNESGKTYRITLPMAGYHNVMNAMATILLARRFGIKFESIQQGFNEYKGTPGRLEIYKDQSRIDFVIDYAHTPDGLEHCLKTLCDLNYKRIIHVFGFRGNRDESKRKKMVEISNEYCDRMILTLDDLNGINPKKMVAELNELSTYCKNDKSIVFPDRTVALQYAWESGLPGDCIVITGKGPELYQQSFTIPTKTDFETIEYIRQDKDSMVSRNLKINDYVKAIDSNR